MRRSKKPRVGADQQEGFMQRTLLIALAAAVLAAGVATTATIVFTGDDDDRAAETPIPLLSPAATSEVETASPTPTASASEEPNDDESASPARTASPPTTAPGVAIRAARDVDCDEDPAFCSSTDRMTVTDDSLDGSLQESSDTKRATRPSIVLESNAWTPSKKDASDGDDIGSIHMEVTVSNSSQKTFVFAKREIVLEVFRNGKLYDRFATSGAGFEMTPGSKMTGTFDRPITQDGSYSWRAKIWYYEKK
jgi:hypothetical protein